MAHSWQKINVEWHSCHSWQEPDQRMITAMTFLILFLVVAALMSVETLRLVFHDGRGPGRPPQSHYDDPRFRSPASIAH